MLSARSRPNHFWFPLLVALSLSAACDDASRAVSEPEPAPEPVAPVVLACSAPAPLEGIPEWSDPRFRGFIVTYHVGTDPVAETARLSTRYGFTPRYVYRYVFPGFAGELAPDAVNAVRCEGSVFRVSVDYWANVLGP